MKYVSLRDVYVHILTLRVSPDLVYTYVLYFEDLTNRTHNSINP